MKLSNVIVALFLFSMIVGGAAIVIGSATNEYDITVNTSFTETYSKINETYETTERMQEKVSQEGGFVSTALNIIVSGTWYVIKLIIGTIGMIGTMMKEFFIAFGIPSIFGAGLLGIFIVIIITAAISVVMRRDV